MAKTKKVGYRRYLGKKQKSRRRAKGYEQMVPAYLSKMLNKVSLNTYNREFVEPVHSSDPNKPSVVSRILSHLPKRDVKGAIYRADKADYERRLREALVLNKKILGDQEALIKQLQMSGADAPSNRTRSKGRHTTDPLLNDLELEAYHTKWSIMQIEDLLRRIERNALDDLPHGFTNYSEFRTEAPGWDMPRMTYTTRFRPPGYPKWR
jgi:hypothetical protein